MALTDIIQRIKTAFMASPILQQAYGFDPNRTFDEQFSELSLEAGDINLFANAQAVTESILESDKTTIQSVIDNNHIGTGPWYVQLAKRFQWHETETYHLIVDPETGIISYNKIAPESRIISQAAFVEGAGKVFLKVAAGEAGNLHKLTWQQQLNLENYMQKMKIAGIMVEIVSLDADLLEIEADVYYNIAFDVNRLRDAIIEALDNYSVNFDYNGIVYRNAVIDAIQAVAGVRDVEIKSLYGIQGANRTEIARAYTTYAGYFNIKKENDFPLINLIAE